MAKIYPLASGALTISGASRCMKSRPRFTAEYLAFFLLALDTSARAGGASAPGVEGHAAGL